MPNSSSLHNIQRRQVKSQRYPWNVSAVVDGETTVGYIAVVMFRGNAVFRQEHELETMAAIAADMAKFLTQGTNAFRRLNFPLGTKTDQFPINLKDTRHTLTGDLTKTGLCAKDAVHKACIEILKLCEEVTHRVHIGVETLSLKKEEKIELDERISELKGETKLAMNSELKETTKPGCLLKPLFTTMKEKRDDLFSIQSQSNQLSTPLAPTEGHRAKGLSDFESCLNETESEDISVSSRRQSEPFLPSNDDVITRDEAELLLGIHKRNPMLLSMQASCSMNNVSLVYLRQSSLYRLINLDQLILAQGWDVEVSGVHLLKGIIVLCAHLNGWKMRRIISFDRKTMEIKLEDGEFVTPLQISNLNIGEDANQCDYLVQEHNYQIEQSYLQPLQMDEIITVQYRLLCAGHTMRKLNVVSLEDAKSLLQQFVQHVVNPVPLEFFASLKKLVTPMSHSEKRRKAETHQKIVSIVGTNMERVFQSWLGTDEQSEDISLDEEVSTFLRHLHMPVVHPEKQILVQRGFAKDPRLRPLAILDIKESCPKRDCNSHTESIECHGNDRVRTRRLSKLNQSFLTTAQANQNCSYLSCPEIERALYKLRRDLHFKQILELK